MIPCPILILMKGGSGFIPSCVTVAIPFMGSDNIQMNWSPMLLNPSTRNMRKN